jgi:hypothetical protein
MPYERGPRDLAARFNFSVQRTREERIRAERRAAADALVEELQANADKLSDEEALAKIRAANIGTVRKGQIREAWLGGRI